MLQLSIKSSHLKLKNQIYIVLALFVLYVVSILIVFSQSVSAANTGIGNSDLSQAQVASRRSFDSCSGSFFGLVPWYQYIEPEFHAKNDAVDAGSACDVKCFNFFAQKAKNNCGIAHSDIPYVLLAIVEDLLRIAGMVAVAFVIVGAIKYITSQGNPESAANAQSTLINALVGLAIAIVAVAFVSFIGNKIG